MMLTQSQYDLLLSFLEKPFRSENGLPDTFSLLEERGFIEASKLTSNGFEFGYPIEWSITPAGREALERFEQCRDDRAQQKRQQRFQNKISVASVLIPLVTFFLGILVEHFGHIIGFFIGLFH